MTELGKHLKEAREAKGLSLDELQSITKIQKRYLLGIEEGNYSMMPGQFYIRAFIRQYAEAVSVDPDKLFEQYKGDIPSSHNEDLPEKLSRVQTRSDIGGRSSKLLDLLPKVMIGVFIIGALFLVWFLLQKNLIDKTDTPAKKDDPSVNFQEKVPDQKSKEKNDKKDGDDASKPEEDEQPEEVKQEQELSVAGTNGKETEYELKNADRFELKIVSTGETWISIRNGSGKSFFQGLLKKGGKESHTVDLSNEDEAVIVVGSAPNTEIYVNDEKLEFAQPPAEKIRQDITIRYSKNTNE